MTVTIGARSTRSSVSSSVKSSSLAAAAGASAPSSLATSTRPAWGSATSYPSSLETRDAVSRSMSWLIVAKMPLLISSRMTSAGFTPRSSASSLTVIVAGSSTAPRSRGSATWTAAANPPSRRGGFRGPRRPLVPLLLRAIECPPAHDSSKLRREADRHVDLEGAPEPALLDRAADAALVTADVGPAPVCLAGRVVDHVTGRRPDHPEQLALVLRRAALDAGSGGRRSTL